MANQGEATEVVRSNRTFMELKCHDFNVSSIAATCSNRTFMELKYKIE